MIWQKSDFLYEGKAKSIYMVEGSFDHIWVHYKDELTAFNAQKKDTLAGKGQLNCFITSCVFNYLKRNHIPVHWLTTIDSNNMVCNKLKMIPIEIVVRNMVAGSLVKRLALEEGVRLRKPLFELYYKNDALNDPFINEEHALLLDAVQNVEEIYKIKSLALKINDLLLPFFAKLNIQLVDYKLEMGWNEQGELVLGDEISPDSCRLWDLSTGQKLDKDRFRQDLGLVLESYQIVQQRIKKEWGEYANWSEGIT